MIAGRRFASGQAGLTLVELLVVIVLLGMISVALFGGIRFGARSWEAGHERLEQINEIEVAQGVLRRLLGGARRVALFDAGRRRESVSFTGRPDEVYFAAPLPTHRGVGGAYGFALRVSRRPDGNHLVLSWRLQRPETPPSDVEDFDDETVLLANVRDVSIAYFGAPEDDRAPAWLESWEGVDGVPRLVRLMVDFEPDSGRYWPPLTIAPALAGPAAIHTQ